MILWWWVPFIVMGSSNLNLYCPGINKVRAHMYKLMNSGSKMYTLCWWEHYMLLQVRMANNNVMTDEAEFATLMCGQPNEYIYYLWDRQSAWWGSPLASFWHYTRLPHWQASAGVTLSGEKPSRSCSQLGTRVSTIHRGSHMYTDLDRPNQSFCLSDHSHVFLVGAILTIKVVGANGY